MFSISFAYIFTDVRSSLSTGNNRAHKQTDKKGRGDVSSPVPHASSTAVTWPSVSDRQHTESKASQNLANVADDLLEAFRKSRESTLAARHLQDLSEPVQQEVRQSRHEVSDVEHQQASLASTSGLLSHVRGTPLCSIISSSLLEPWHLA